MPVLSNPKHELFAQEIAKGTPGRDAYKAAGYAVNTDAAADVNASRLLSDAKVKARIDEILAKAAAKVGVTVERVVAELAKIGFSDIRKAVKWGHQISFNDESGEPQIVNGVGVLNSDEIDADTSAAISEVAQTKDGIKIKFHDKRAALADLGRHLGMFGSDAASANITIKVIGGLPE